MVYIKRGEVDWGWGASVNFTRKKNLRVKSKKGGKTPEGN